MKKQRDFQKIKLIFPLFLIELYLSLTLFLFKVGPVKWRLENESIFWVFIILCNLMFAIGYLLSLKKHNVIIEEKKRKEKLPRYICFVFLFLSLIATIIFYRNLVRCDSYLPKNFFSELYKGLVDPAGQYYNKMSAEANNNFMGNDIITGFFGIIAFSHYLLPPLIVFMWERIDRVTKILAFVIVFISFSAYVSVGTNKGLFDLLFMFVSALIIETLINFKENRWQTVRSRRFIVMIIVFLFFFTILFFVYGFRNRVDINSISNEDSYRITNVSKSITSFDDTHAATDNSEIHSFFETGVIGIDLYLTQGYYGLSLAMDEKFDTTYGIGNSHFLIRIVDEIFGIDINSRTYQYKINEKWDEYGHWHSFYSQVANDVSFLGVPIVFFILGFVISAVWKNAIIGNELISKCLVIMFVIMVLYFPANNQIMNIMESFFVFWELIFLRIVLLIKTRNRELGKEKVTK